MPTLKIQYNIMKYFGTDGIRGIFNEDLKNVIYKAGYACGFLEKRILLARDTRTSGEILSRIFTKGAMNAGATIRYAGILPTPALSVAVKNSKELGVMITASHNSKEYNGLKLFSSDGRKYRELDKLEVLMDKCEQEFSEGLLPPITEIPMADYLSSFDLEKYINGGLKIAVDLANGAMRSVAPRILGQIGRCTCLNANGEINFNCGVFHPKNTVELVRSGYDVGFIFDGDGDRLLVIDEKGNLLDGDGILYVLSTAFFKNGELTPRKIVCTEMSNGGLKKSLAPFKIDCYRSKVGDDNVAKLMEKKGAVLGGESSGHILIGNHSADGLRTAVEICKLLIRERKPLSHFTKDLTFFPTLNEDLPYNEEAFKSCERLAEKWQSYLCEKGRVIVRKSGTEPLLRICVEGVSEELTREIMKELISAYKKVCQ